MEKRERFCTVGGNVNWYSHHGRQYRDSLKNQEWNHLMTHYYMPLGIYPEETKILKNTCIPMFIAALFAIARTWRQTRWPLTDEWIKKLWYMYTMEYYSAIKRNIFESVLMRWMKLEPIIQSEVSQKEKEKDSNTYIQNLGKWYWRMYSGNNGETDMENRLMDMGGGEERVRYMERVTWKLTLPYVK